MITYLTPDEVKDRLRLKSLRTLEGWRQRRQGPPFRKFGSRVLYPVDLLVKWELAQTVETV